MQEAVARRSEPKVEPKDERPKESPAAPATVKPGGFTIELVTPVQAWGDTVKQLTFRKPTGADIMAMGDGYPIMLNALGQVVPNNPIMGNMMAVLAGVPPSTIKLLDAEDWAKAAFKLIRFFNPTVEEPE